MRIKQTEAETRVVISVLSSLSAYLIDDIYPSHNNTRTHVRDVLIQQSRDTSNIHRSEQIEAAAAASYRTECL